MADLENEKLKRENDLAHKNARLVVVENENLKKEKDLALQKTETVNLENERLKMERELALQKAKIAELEKDKLRVEKDLAVQKSKSATLQKEMANAEKEKLAVENRNLQLEIDNKALETENLEHRIENLEEESDRLKKVLTSQKNIPAEVREAVRIRVEMLNAHLARTISSNEKLGRPYDIWVEAMTNNAEEFMNSTRLTFQISHPGFIQYLIDHGLTIDEINYVCLYAIGLNGGEVGAFIKRRGHGNISSAIRKKFGLDSHDTNMSIYVRGLLKELG